MSFTELSQRRKSRRESAPTTFTSISVIALLVATLLILTLGFGAPIEVAMFAALVIIMIVLSLRGFTIDEIQEAAYDSMRSVLIMILILLTVGMLVGSWAEAGTIPYIIQLGIKLIDPTWFYTTAILLCSATSLVTGTSWGTMGSVGIALMAIGSGLGLPPAVTAGAVISGAYFGDKLSLLSDTTNLSAAITRTPILTHMKYMLITTTPAYIGTIIIFQIIGFVFAPDSASMGAATAITNSLDQSFELNWITLLPAVVTIGMLVLRLPPYIAIFGGVVGAAIVSVTVQGESLSDVITTIYSGFTLDSGAESIDDLISGGGMMSMAGISFLFLFAVGVAGLLDKGGFTTAIIGKLLKMANTRRRLMVTSSPLTMLALALGANFSFAGVLVGTLLSPAYKKMGLKSQNLSRTIEDSGTVYDPFFPWSAGGLFTAGTLGIATLDYMPFLFFAYLSTLFGLLVAVTQYKVATISPGNSQEAAISPDDSQEAVIDSQAAPIDSHADVAATVSVGDSGASDRRSE